MRIYYYDDEEGNYGDDINPWMWPRLFPELREAHEEVTFVGIGTVLNQSLPKEGPIVIMGAGAGYGEFPRRRPDWDVYFVRGPRTAECLGLPIEDGISDPALLLRTFEWGPAPKKYDVSFMPHHSTMWLIPWRALCSAFGVHFISPRDSVEHVTQQIRASRRLVTEAMHGAIAADAFGVPWLPMRVGGGLNAFKWSDYTTTVGRAFDPVDRAVSFRSGKLGLVQRFYKPAQVPYFIERVLEKEQHRFETTPANVVSRRIEQMIERLQAFSSAYGMRLCI